MKLNIDTSLVQRRLTRLAREYRQQGYDVTLHPSPKDLPDEVIGCSFDLIAKRDEEVVAAVVRTRQTLAQNGPHDLRRIATAINQQPNWDLELVITNPHKRRPAKPSVNETLPA